MWWFNRLPKHLPEPSGPFIPGCMDVMLDYNEDGVFMRFYYPTDYKNDDASVMPSRWPSWIPDDSYLMGLAEFLRTFLFIVRTVLWWSSKRIPTIYGAKPRIVDKLKCVIFSHGLGGTRFISSTILNDLASRGYLVVSLEHRDHSACQTYYYQSKDDVQNDKRTFIKYRKIQFGRAHYEKRYEQVCYRANECQKVLDFILDLNQGNVPSNILDDLPIKWPIAFELSDFVGKLDCDTITIGGHSFGGATALLALAQRPEFRQGILLDPWMFPIKNNKLEQKLKQPLLFINTQTFHIATNVNAMAKFLNRDNVKMYTILRTTHENQTDSVFITGYWLNWFMTKLDPLIAWKINDFLILDFLNDFIDGNQTDDDCRQFLNEHKQHIDIGLTKPWA